MIFMKIAALMSSDDANYYKFRGLEECIAYIQFEHISNYVISDNPEIPENDYILVEVNVVRNFEKKV